MTAGALDPTFGSGSGYVSTDTGSKYDGASVVAVEPWDGKIVVADHPSNANAGTNYDFILIRYNTDGSLDTSFGSGGIVTTDFNGGNDSIGAGLRHDQSQDRRGGQRNRFQGKGSRATDRRRPLQCRRLARHHLRQGRRGVGPGLDGLPVQRELRERRRADPSGRLVIAGSYVGQKRFGGFNYANALVRFNPNGSLDTTFGNGGTVVGPIGSYTYDGWQALHLTPSGNDYKIDVAGKDGGIDGTLAQFNSNGSRDTTFGTGGSVALAGGGAHLHFVPDGGLIATSNVSTSPSSPLIRVTRYAPNGVELFDNTVDLSWLLPPDVTFSTIEEPSAVAVDSSGRIVIAGTIMYTGSTSTTRHDAMLLRLDSSGNLDTSFGNNGVVISDFGPYDDEFSSVAIAADGSIIAAGDVDNGDGTYDSLGNANWQKDILVARYQSS